MVLESGERQTSGEPERALAGRGEAPRGKRRDEPQSAIRGDERSGNDGEKLLELVVERSNVEASLRRVKKNKGSPGVDGTTVQELPAYLAEHWPRIREELLASLRERERVDDARRTALQSE